MIPGHRRNAHPNHPGRDCCRTLGRHEKFPAIDLETGIQLGDPFWHILGAQERDDETRLQPVKEIGLAVEQQFFAILESKDIELRH
jgi:hypothetical protein